MIFLLLTRAPFAYGDRPGFGLSLPDHRHVRDFLKFGVPNAISQRFPLIDFGAESRISQVLHQLLGTLDPLLGDGQDPDLLRGQP